MNDEILKVVSGICNDTNGCLKLSMIIVAGLGVLGTIMQNQYTVKGSDGALFQPTSKGLPKNTETYIGAANNTSV